MDGHEDPVVSDVSWPVSLLRRRHRELCQPSLELEHDPLGGRARHVDVGDVRVGLMVLLGAVALALVARSVRARVPRLALRISAALQSMCCSSSASSRTEASAIRAIIRSPSSSFDVARRAVHCWSNF